MKILQAFNHLKSIRANLRFIINTRECSVKGIEQDIEFLKKLFDDNLEFFTAEEQNKLINLIQKLVLIRDMKKAS